MLSYQIYSTLGGVQIPDCQPLFSLYLVLWPVTIALNILTMRIKSFVSRTAKLALLRQPSRNMSGRYYLLLSEPQSWYFLCLKYPIIGGISTLRFFLDLVIAKSVNPWIAFNTEIFFSCRIKNLRPKVVVVTLLISILALAGIIEWLRWLWWKRNKRGSSHRRRDETRIKTNICSVFVDIFICLVCVVEQKIKSNLRALK